MESSFQIAVCECPDIVANTMAVDVTGRYALMSGRKSIALVDLDGGNLADNASANGSNISEDVAMASNQISSNLQPKFAPIVKKMMRNSKYEPTASHFNRHMIDLFALTTNQVAEIFSIEDLNPQKPKLILKGHSRAIADIEWSQFDPYLLGSSAADCITNLWDIRDSRRPSASLTSVSGATQVRFSKTSSNLIATSHEIDVRIWDIRQPNLPLYYIAAHLQKINGMDWNPNKTSCDHEQIITCSQDNTIKLWDLNANKIKPSANLPTRTPAWRVRYHPVSSNAILTSTFPQIRSRAECTALKLWSLKPSRYEQKKLELIMGLVGHSDVIVDFDWRYRQSSTGCEIVSWSKDQTLRVWRIDNQFIEINVDHSDFEAECEVPDTPSESVETSSYANETSTFTNETSLNQKADTTSELTSESFKNLSAEEIEQLSKVNKESDSDASILVENSEPTNELKQEFDLINKNIPNIEFEELNYLKRICLVAARAKGMSCRLKISLPLSYPQDECPTFTIIDSGQYGTEALNKDAREKLLNLLNETAMSQLSANRNCLEPCLRKFVVALQRITNYAHRKRPIGSSSGGMNQDPKDDIITLSAQKDHSIPFPNTCGARFCGNLLVCFGRPIIPTSSGTETANYSVETPRSLAQLSAQLDNMRRQGSYNLNHISISYFYYGAMRRSELQTRISKSSSSGRSGSKFTPSRNKSALQSQSIISKSYKCGPVLIYDVTDLLGGISRDLAENYVFDKDVIKMCQRNAEVAAKYNRKDLVQIWSLAKLSSEGVLHSFIPNKGNDRAFSLIAQDSDFGDRPWTMHPFGSKLIQSLIDHYVNNCHDVQTAAMLVWTFSSPKLEHSTRNQTLKLNTSSGKMNPLQYSMVASNHQSNIVTAYPNKLIYHQVDAISDEWNFVSGTETHLYSNSWSNSAIYENMIDSQSNDIGKSNNKSYCNEVSENSDNSYYEEKFPKLNILSPERSLQNDLIMHIYAQVLYRLNLLNQRAMILKNVGSNSVYAELFGNKQTSTESLEERLSNLTIQCYNSDCHNKCKSAQCPSCKRYSLYCSICRLPVKGSCSVCLKCQHGGHVNHFNTWFNEYDFCPTGCGCKCLGAEY